MNPENKDYPNISPENEKYGESYTALPPDEKKTQRPARLSIVLSLLTFIGFMIMLRVFFDTEGDGLALAPIFFTVLVLLIISIVLFIAHIIKARSAGQSINKKAMAFILLALCGLIINIIIPKIYDTIETNKDNKRREQSSEQARKEEAQKQADSEKAIGYIEKYGFYYLSLDKFERSLKTGYESNNKRPVLVWADKLLGYNPQDPRQVLTQAVYIDQAPLDNERCYGFTPSDVQCVATKMKFKNYPIYRTTSSPREYVFTDGIIRISLHAQTDDEAQARINSVKKASSAELKVMLTQSEIDVPLFYSNNEIKLR